MEGRFSIDAIFKAIDRISAPVEKIRSRTQRAFRAIHRATAAAGQALQQFGRVLSRLAVAGVAAGTAALYGLGRGMQDVIRTGADFDQAMASVAAVSLMTRDEVADLEKKALDLGASTKFTATEAANAMEILGRAGFSNAQVLASVDAILAAAAASGTDMAEVASHVSNTLNGMGLEAKEAARVADVLALAEARTNSSFVSLGESMKNLAPVARQLNVSFEEAVASVALLQDVGIDASEAGTATATMLTKLTKPTDDVAAKMKKLGIQFKDAKGNALAFPEILGQFEKAANKAGGNMEVIAFFADLVGLRGQKAALNLKDMFASGKFSKLVEELQGAAGTAKKMADLRMDSLTGDITMLESAIDGVKIALFQTQDGPLRDIVQGMTAWVERNRDFIRSGFVTAIERGKQVLSAVVPLVRKFIEGFTGKADPAGKVRSISEGFDALLERIKTPEFEAMAQRWGERLGVVADAAAKIGGALVSVLPTLALLADAMQRPLDKVREFAGAGLGAGAGGLFGALGKAADVLRSGFELMLSMPGRIMDLASRAGAAITGVFERVKSAAMPAIHFVVGAAVIGAAVVQRLWRPVGEFFSRLWSSISALASAAYERVLAVWAPVAEFFGGVWAAVVEITRPAIEGITAIAQSVYDTFTGIWSGVVGFFEGLWAAAVDTFDRVFGPVLDKIAQVIAFVQSVGAAALAGDLDGISLPEGTGSDGAVVESLQRIERNSTETGELVIRDETGRAAMKRPMKRLKLQPTGAL